MRAVRNIGKYPLFLICAVSGVAFFIVKGLGLLSDVGDSQLNRNPTFTISIKPAPLAAGLFLTLALILLYRFRRRLTLSFLLAVRFGSTRPVRFAFRAAAALFLLHAALFLPFRYNELRLPDPTDDRFEIRYRGNQPERTLHCRAYEDYTRNYVVSRSIRRLGVNRYFDLHRAQELTGTDRKLCSWALRNHPPGYHLLLVPFTVHPLLARGLSLVLYALVLILAFLALRPLTGTAPAALGTLIFWGTPANLFFIGMMTSNDLAVAVPILGGLALITNARAPSPGQMLLAGFVFGIAFVTKYTAILGAGLGCLAVMVRFGCRRGIKGSTYILLGFAPLVAVWFTTLSSTPAGEDQYGKYVEELLHKVTDPARLGRASSAARGELSDFFAFLPAEWGPPAFLAMLAAILWLPFSLRKVGRTGVFALMIFLLPFLAAIISIPKTNYIYFAQAGLFSFTALFLLKALKPSGSATPVVESS